jgi:prolipoprotein diacylglyceryltransferase
MRPVLLQWRKLTIWSYPAMLFIGLSCGVVTGNVVAHADGLNPLRVYIATLILIVPALAGARLLYVIANWQNYRSNPTHIWDRSQGGYVMYGGFPAMLLVSIPVLRLCHLGFGAFWDVGIFTILVGMFFTRIGCLLNGCCAGDATDRWLGFYLPNSRGIWQKRFPTQIFEAGLAGMLLICAVALRHSVPFPGALFLLMSAGYAGGRLLTEFARERKPSKAGFNLAHVISLVICLTCVSSLTIYWRR